MPKYRFDGELKAGTVGPNSVVMLGMPPKSAWGSVLQFFLYACQLLKNHFGIVLVLLTARVARTDILKAIKTKAVPQCKALPIG